MEREFPIPSDTKINLKKELDLNKEFDEKESAFDLFSYLFGLEENPEYKDFLKNHLGELRKFVKITRFSENDNETFYREREWRSKKGDFEFNENDLEALILPEKFIDEVKQHLIDCDYEKNITIIPFEFLERA